MPGRRVEPSCSFVCRIDLEAANAVLRCAAAIADHSPVNRFLKAFGIILLLSGLAHAAGVVRFYLIAGVPDANRVLLDVWVAEGLLLGGSLYLAACAASRAGQSPRVLTIFGSLTIIGFTAPMTPVLISRAPIHFVLLTVIYLLLGVVILARAIATASPTGRRLQL